MFQSGLYKRSQGRITRQVTFAALAVGFAVGWWRLARHDDSWAWFRSCSQNLRNLDFGLPVLVAGIGVFAAGDLVCVSDRQLFRGSPIF